MTLNTRTTMALAACAAVLAGALLIRASAMLALGFLTLGAIAGLMVIYDTDGPRVLPGPMAVACILGLVFATYMLISADGGAVEIARIGANRDVSIATIEAQRDVTLSCIDGGWNAFRCIEAGGIPGTRRLWLPSPSVLMAMALGGVGLWAMAWRRGQR